MQWRVALWAGILAMAIGFIWTLQGLGYLGGSGMTDDRRWAVIGPVVAVGGAVLAIISRRRIPRS